MRTTRLWTVLVLVFAAAAAVAEVPGDEDRYAGVPPPVCWRGLGALEGVEDVGALRDALRDAALADDHRLVEYLKQRLTDRIGGNAAIAATVLGWASEADDFQARELLEALKAAPAVRIAAIRDGLLAMAESHHDPAHASLAAAALDTQDRFSDGELTRLAALVAADTPQGEAAGWVATRTIGRVMETDHRATGEYTAYFSRLLDIATSAATDGTTRYVAIEMGTYADPPFGPAELERLGAILLGDPRPATRNVAALVMSTARDKDRLLELYRQAFLAETSHCVRWAILIYALRAGGADALPMAEEFVAVDPRFADSLSEMETMIRTGTVDFTRVWDARRVEQPCVGHEGDE